MQPKLMPKSIPFQPRDRLQVTLKGTRKESLITYASGVESIQGGDIVIQWPISGGVRAVLQEADLLCLAYMKGADVFAVDAHVLKLLPYPDSLVLVRCEEQTRKIQRRDYVRVPAMIDVRVTPRVVMNTATGEERPAHVITSTTVNISGGGFSVQSRIPLEMGGVYDVEMVIPTIEGPLSLTAKVVRMEPVLNPMRKSYYDIGFDFILLSEPIRREIIKYVFRFQQNTLAIRT
jgi:hypothetical protein